MRALVEVSGSSKPLHEPHEILYNAGRVRRRFLEALLHDLRHPLAGRGGTNEVFAEAARHTAQRLRRFEPRDQMWVVAGLACLATSYLIGIVIWFAGNPAATQG